MTYTHGQHSLYIEDSKKYQDYYDKGELVITMYDNNNVKHDAKGTEKSVKLSDEDKKSENIEASDSEYSRIITYAINFEDKTFELINTINLEYYSPFCSNVYEIYDKYYIVFSAAGAIELYDFDGNQLINISDMRGSIPIKHRFIMGYRGYIYTNEQIQNSVSFTD